MRHVKTLFCYNDEWICINLNYVMTNYSWVMKKNGFKQKMKRVQKNEEKRAKKKIIRINHPQHCNHR